MRRTWPLGLGTNICPSGRRLSFGKTARAGEKRGRIAAVYTRLKSGPARVALAAVVGFGGMTVHAEHANAGQFNLDWTVLDYPAGSLGPETFTITDQFGFELQARISVTQIGGANTTGVSSPEDRQTFGGNTFGTSESLWLIWDANAGSSGIGESTVTTTIEFLNGGSPFGVDNLSLRVYDVDSVDSNGAATNDRCDHITLTGNAGNPTLSYGGGALTPSVIIGPGPGAGSSPTLASNQAQCDYNLSGSSVTSNGDDAGTVIADYPAGTHTATIALNESIENVFGVTNRNAAARGVGVLANLQIDTIDTITLTKAASVSSFGAAGETITYTYTVTNNGPLPINAAQDIVIDDDKIGQFICSAGPLAVSATTTCTATYTTTAADITAGVVTNDAIAGVGTAGQAFATRLQSNTATENVNYLATTPSFTLSKVSNKSSVSVNGEVITYTITAVNNGSVDLTGVNITDVLTQDINTLTLTSGPTLVSSGNGDAIFNQAETWIWNATYAVTQAVLDDGNDIVNTATVTTNEAPTQVSSVATTTPGTTFICAGDNWPGNSISGISGSTDCNNIGATGQGGEQAPGAMGAINSIWYEWTAPINGTVEFNTCDTSFTDYDTFLSAYSQPGTTIGDLNLITFNDDGTGCANFSSRMSFTAVAGTTYYIQVDGWNTSTGNFRLQWNMTPDQADLSLAKIVDDPAPIQGDDVTYTLTVTNSGPDLATGVDVTDLLPSGLSFVSATPSQGTYAAGTGLWDVGNLTNGAVATLDIVATVTGSGTINNVAEVTASDTLDPDSTPGNGSEDDFASVPITAAPSVSSLSISKIATFGSPVQTADGATDNVGLGDTITYTYTITNTGNQVISNITLTDTHGGLGLPVTPNPDVGVLNDAAPTGDSVNPVSGDNAWDALGPGDELTVTATYVVVQEDIDQRQ